MTTKTIPTAPLTIDVASSQTIEDILTRTKGLLELIQTVCNAAAKEDAENLEEVFAPHLVKSLSMMCCFAAQDLANVETYLSNDGPAFHHNQLEDLARQAPGGVR